MNEYSVKVSAGHDTGPEQTKPTFYVKAKNRDDAFWKAHSELHLSYRVSGMPYYFIQRLK